MFRPFFGEARTQSSHLLPCAQPPHPSPATMQKPSEKSETRDSSHISIFLTTAPPFGKSGTSSLLCEARPARAWESPWQPRAPATSRQRSSSRAAHGWGRSTPAAGRPGRSALRAGPCTSPCASPCRAQPRGAGRSAGSGVWWPGTRGLQIPGALTGLSLRKDPHP